MRLKFLFLCISILTLISCEGDNTTYVIIETEYGNMKAELYDSTPKHKENFINLVESGYYDDLLFHRVINGFMIQGGDPDSKNAKPGQPLGSGGPGYKVDAEIGSPHFKGTLAAARTGYNNPEKKSSGSQFYVVQGALATDKQLDDIEQRYGIKYNETQRQKYKELGGRPDLDMEYTVFGEVVEGLEVIDKIAKVQTDDRNRPLEDVRMKIRMAE